MARKNRKASRRNEPPFWERHALSLTATGGLALWLVLYVNSDPKSHGGSFFGNGVAQRRRQACALSLTLGQALPSQVQGTR